MNSQSQIPLPEASILQESGNETHSIYRYQLNSMPVLLGWATGSMVAGLLWMRSKSDWLRGFGSQFLGWGAIDGAITAAGMNGAAQNEKRLHAGEITAKEHARQAINFERFVWLNALLDIGYMLGGWMLVRRNPDDRQRQGMGWGILAQGAFLFIWDILLASGAQRKRRGA
jgi:Family of unknown function (DUF6992)